MSKSFLFVLGFVIVGWVEFVPAHPLDSFAVDQYVDLRFQAERVRVIHRIEFAEIPTVAELPRVDLNSSLSLEPEETGPYLDKTIAELLDHLALSIDRQKQKLTFVEGRVFLEGLPVPRLRVITSYDVPAPSIKAEGTAFEFFLRHRPTARGDRQVRLICQGKLELRDVWSSDPITPIGMAAPYVGDATALQYGHVTRWKLVPSEIEHRPVVPAIQSGTATLAIPPTNPFFSLNERGFGGDFEGSFPFDREDLYPGALGGPSGASPAIISPFGAMGVTGSAVKEVEEIYAKAERDELGEAARPEFAGEGPQETQETWADRQFRSLFTSGVTGKGFGFLLFASLLSLVYGAAHAMEPGHGKTIVGAYLIGSKGTVYHAVLLALVVTFTHTFSVYILGVIALTNLDRVQGAYLPILECGSWALIIFMGIWLFLKYYKAYVMGLLADPTYHSHGFGAGHTHGPLGHAHDHPHDHGHGHHHTHDHPHDHGHGHHHPHDHPHDHDHGHHHTHDHPHEHDHGHDHPHAKAAPKVDAMDAARDVSFWNLLVLGLTGGIVPCPGALFVMMMALTSGQPLIGLYLITVFSIGLALMLMTVGIVMVKSRSVVGRYTPNSRFVQMLPVLSSLVIIVVGAGFFIAGLMKHGILKIGL